ncbi:MAG: response regulator transcription factor [Alphaproteobacteria bacterium]|nr:response regulator transcription factor [Alphaproteobacteria bacterium]
MHILLIEDDKVMNASITALLKHSGMTVESALLAKDGLELLKVYEYDLIILDLMLPDMTGVDALCQIRSAGLHTPVLVLSGILLPNKKVECLSAGADDYLTKPFNNEELIARVNAIVRRSKGHADPVVRVGKMEINLGTKVVTVAGKVLPLTGKEYALMELLALKKGSTVSKDQFLTHLYGGMDEPEVKIIDVFFCKIRSKIKELSGGEDYITTVWGRGYILQDTQN